MLRNPSVPTGGCLCSFDVVSLFTNVPLLETVDIRVKALFHNPDVTPPTMSEKSFRSLMIMVTSGGEFSFDDVMYRQIDGVAMGSPLGPVLTNIFVGYCESLVPQCEFPSLYCHVDDSHAYFANREQADVFKSKLDRLHPSLKFTCEFESSNSLSFLDVLVTRNPDGGVVTSVYRKPTFTGMCLQWDSYCPVKHKVGLVKCVVDRARRICSKSKLQDELEYLKTMFEANGYPSNVTKKYITEETTPTSEKPTDDTPRIVLRLPYVGEKCNIVRRVRTSVRRTFGEINLVIVYNSRRALTMKKEVLPSQLISKIIYAFECGQCASRYVGRILQHLSARIKQHVPLHLLSARQRQLRPRRGRPPKIPQTASPLSANDAITPPPRRSSRLNKPTGVTVTNTRDDRTLSTTGTQRPRSQDKQYQSAIAQHLYANSDCSDVYSDDCFVVLSRGRSRHHLQVLESVYIHTQRPNLCKQKQNCASLLLFKSSISPM